MSAHQPPNHVASRHRGLPTQPFLLIQVAAAAPPQLIFMSCSQSLWSPLLFFLFALLQEAVYILAQVVFITASTSTWLALCPIQQQAASVSRTQILLHFACWLPACRRISHGTAELPSIPSDSPMAQASYHTPWQLLGPAAAGRLVRQTGGFRAGSHDVSSTPQQLPRL